MKFKILVIAACLVIAGCDGHDPETSTLKGVGIKVDTLFTDDDGCTVKRFEDAGRLRYYTNCPGTTMYNESCGKNCVTQGGVSGR